MSTRLTKLQMVAYRAIRILDGAASPEVVEPFIRRIERRFGFRED
jgi:hypothetical protein